MDERDPFARRASVLEALDLHPADRMAFMETMRTELEHSDQNPASEVARFRKEYLQVRLDAFGEVVGSTNGAEAVSI